MNIPCSSFTSPCYDILLFVLSELYQNMSGFHIFYDRTDRNNSNLVWGIGSISIFNHSVLSILSSKMAILAKIDKRLLIFTCFQDNITSFTSISSCRTSKSYSCFTTSSYASISSITRLYSDANCI